MKLFTVLSFAAIGVLLCQGAPAPQQQPSIVAVPAEEIQLQSVKDIQFNVARVLDHSLSTLTFAECMKYLSESLDKKVSLRDLLIEIGRRKRQFLSRLQNQGESQFHTVHKTDNAWLNEVQVKQGQIITAVQNKGKLLAQKKQIVARVQEKGQDLLNKKKEIISNVQGQGQELLNQKKRIIANAQQKGEKFMANVHQQGEALISNVQHMGEELLKQKKQIVANVQQKGEDFIANVQHQGEALISNVQQQGQALMANVQNTAKELLESVYHTGEELLAKKKQVISNVQQQGQALISNVQKQGEALISNVQHRGEELLAKNKQLLSNIQHTGEQFIEEVMEEAKQKASEFKAHNGNHHRRRRAIEDDDLVVESLVDLLEKEDQLRDFNEVDAKNLNAFDPLDIIKLPITFEKKPAHPLSPNEPVLQYYTLPELARQFYEWARYNLSLRRVFRPSSVVSA